MPTTLCSFHLRRPVSSTEPTQLVQANALLYNSCERAAQSASKAFTDLSTKQTGPIEYLTSSASKTPVNQQKAAMKPQRCPDLIYSFLWVSGNPWHFTPTFSVHQSNTQWQSLDKKNENKNTYATRWDDCKENVKHGTNTMTNLDILT